MKAEEKIRTEATWKRQYDLMFAATPKRQRMTSRQVETMKQKAKLYITLFGTI